MSQSIDYISCYTRAEAIADGFLIDVTKQAKRAGFTIPVAITQAAYGDCVTWVVDEAQERKPNWAGLPSDHLRLTCLLVAAMQAIRKHLDSNSVHFEVQRVPFAGTSEELETVSLTMVVSGGDNGEPVITIGFDSDF